VSLPMHFHEPIKSSAKPASKPLTQWERTRLEMRGEKMDRPEKGQEPPRETLTDKLLKVLAENGQHFQQLPNNEHITVAVTLRPLAWSNGCMACHTAQNTQPKSAPVGGASEKQEKKDKPPKNHAPE